MKRGGHPGLAAATIVLGAAGCGGDDGPATGGGRSALVDPSTPPLVNALEREPGGRALLLSTNRGLYRVAGGRATRTSPRLTGSAGSAPIGRQLVVLPVRGRELIGSGHPDLRTGRLPEFLGLLRSADGGRTWQPVSGLGVADYHTLKRAGGRIVGADGAQGALAYSADGGRTFTQRPIPDAVSFDMAADPSQPRRAVVSNELTVLRTEDAGATWRPVTDARFARLEWPEPGTLLRADEDGTVHASADAGANWERRGQVDGAPQQLLATDARTLFVALADARIVGSTDGGRTWRTVFTPPGA